MTVEYLWPERYAKVGLDGYVWLKSRNAILSEKDIFKYERIVHLMIGDFSWLTFKSKCVDMVPKFMMYYLVFLI